MHISVSAQLCLDKTDPSVGWPWVRDQTDLSESGNHGRSHNGQKEKNKAEGKCIAAGK